MTTKAKETTGTQNLQPVLKAEILGPSDRTNLAEGGKNLEFRTLTLLSVLPDSNLCLRS